ncbi:hypothetical protein AGABI1DRAFT_112996 [Agaricus bisporus var. burnettii JB137-S8]|uniref:Uncharacterized protein n=1 Tax=Agaricus bisporus var. burnettii (strain JB137-S8 / ATCC MYA-4627 / FGSC 10392) TaxID=597362 RepID=K5W3G1_AGABU|nr:uncharacterized protein AGABI1DRAFT_112996 [Agaricus bisporus var. burnettii JB137-S8]EKM81334.1 hypothetical protein AGABI1DRAFT_112996 [Agaricus bisporus var. burnettii JB137-S8]
MLLSHLPSTPVNQLETANRLATSPTLLVSGSRFTYGTDRLLRQANGEAGPWSWFRRW